MLSMKINFQENETIYYKLLVSTKTSSYERLQTLEFDSVRKRMSVIIRDPKGVIRLVCKGAEVTILPNCHSSSR